MPLVLGTVRLVDSTKSSDVAGTAFGYVDSAGTRVDVFLYAVPPARLSQGATASLEHEAAVYLRALAQEARENGYERFEEIVDTLRHVEIDDGSVPVRIIVSVSARPQGTFVSFAHLFVLGSHYLKVRLTLPSQVWQVSRAPDFALDLIKQLHSRH